MNRIIEGMRVIEASAFIAAPFGGMTLAQMGADVIRIDPIGGGLDINRWPVTRDGASLYWAGLNKGKRSVTIDLRSPEGRELAQALATAPGPQAGILLTNLPTRGWLDPASLRARRSDLIMASVIGNRDGTAALDYTVNVAVGFPMVTGPVEHSGPVNHVMPVWDLVAGYALVSGILAAERKRSLTGEGEFMQLALSDTGFAALSHLGLMAEVQINGDERPRNGNHVYGTFGHDFRTSDGRHVMVTAFTQRHWTALVEATCTQREMQAIEQLYEVKLIREEARWTHREAIVAFMRPWFTSRTLAEVRAGLDAAGACWGPYQTFAQAVREDPRASTANPLFNEIDQPGIGRHLAAGAMLDFEGAPRIPVTPAPRLGQDTDAVLAEVLGLESGAIGRLHDAGVVAG